MFPSFYYPEYTYSSRHWFFRDQPLHNLSASIEEYRAHKSMLFHIGAGDYITTLATILRFFEETIYDEKTTPEMRELQLKTIQEVIKDLLYMDKHYTIMPKER